MARLALAIAASIPAGIALGVAGQGIDHVDARLRWVAALGVPWLLVAFALGALTHRVAGGHVPPRAALAGAAASGALALAVATGAWYALVVLSTGHALYPAYMTVAWLPAAVACGALFALAGAGWASGGRIRRPLGAAVAAGALVGEVLALDGEWSTRAAHAVLAAELAAGLLLPFVLARRAATAAFALTVVVALAMGAAETEVRDTLRAAGWRGL
jgi:hypothetical protein